MNKYNLIFTKEKLSSYSLESDKITVFFESEKKEVGALMDFFDLYPEIISDSFKIFNSKDEIFLDWKSEMGLIEYPIENLEKFLISKRL